VSIYALEASHGQQARVIIGATRQPILRCCGAGTDFAELKQHAEPTAKIAPLDVARGRTDYPAGPAFVRGTRDWLQNASSASRLTPSLGRRESRSHPCEILSNKLRTELRCRCGPFAR
jgi:hypothetical protein